jgi:undecaprenyl-diphosphatase
MDILQAIIYGVVQGLGEFLPISSTAHITLLPWLFGWKDPGLTFDVALHIGTLFAVIIYFWKDWIRLIKAGITNIKSNDGKLFWFIVIACIPGGIIGVLFHDQVETIFRNPALIGMMLIAMGLVLYIADRVGQKTYDLENVGLLRSLLIGVSQGLAVIPGVSRSGITMATGRFFGLTREGAARFTFLLSTPFIFLSGVYEARNFNNLNIEILPFAIAIVTSAVVGILSIQFLLSYIKNRGFGIFVIYRIIVGIAVIFVYYLRLRIGL